ncbi:Putative Trans-2-enoyl-CoA reductase [Serratia symbiotica]|nr:Putative Trans-2-enoyl-CoA reductase [Serratia symbiotica]
MIIKPKIRGFICTTAHPEGCEANVNKQISYIKSCNKLKNGPKKILIIGASTGYGLASRINSAFSGDGGDTIGIFLEKNGNNNKTGSAGWYNSFAFHKAAKKSGLYSKNINGDAFSNECKKNTINIIKKDLGKIDLIIYSLASSVRKIPNNNKIIRSVIKPIGKTYNTITINTKKDSIVQTTIEPANKQEIIDTISVMGGQDWELWIDALIDANVLADNVKTISYSYIGTSITWPIYRHGTLGKAKEHLENTAKNINKKLKFNGGNAYIAILKSVVTQASSAIPVMPLYISILFKIMKEKNIHEGCIEQIQRLFQTKLYTQNITKKYDNYYRLDEWELHDNIQNACYKILSKINQDNLYKLTDYLNYKKEFLRLFGFGLPNINYDKFSNHIINFDTINLI